MPEKSETVLGKQYATVMIAHKSNGESELPTLEGEEVELWMYEANEATSKSAVGAPDDLAEEESAVEYTYAESAMTTEALAEEESAVEYTLDESAISATSA